MIVSGYHVHGKNDAIKDAVESILTNSALKSYEVTSPVGKLQKQGMALSSLAIMVKARTGFSIGKKDQMEKLLESMGFEVWTKTGLQRMTIVSIRPSLKVVAGTDLQQTG